jgi:hypothetical protein
LKINFEKDEYKFYLYNRTIVLQEKFKFELVTCFDVCNKVLQKNNLLLGYEVNSNTKIFFRALNDGFRKQNFSM